MTYEELEREYQEMISKPVYMEFTNIVLATIGNHIAKKYPDLSVDVKQRDKTEKSFQKKAKDHVRLEGEDKAMLYDYLGFRIVVTDVPYDFRTEISDIDSELEKLLTKKMDAEEALNAEKFLYNDFILRFTSEKSSDLYKIAEDEILKNLEHLKAEYVIAKDDSELFVSDFLIKELSNSKQIQNLGITPIPGRLIIHRKENGYFATHNSWIVGDENSKYYGWKCEVQSKSSLREYLAHDGPASHTERPGKKRILPPYPIDMTQGSIEAYRKIVEYEVPQYRVYRRTGDVRVCSTLENFLHYHKKSLLKNPNYLQRLIKDDILNSSNYKIFSFEN